MKFQNFKKSCILGILLVNALAFLALADIPVDPPPEIQSLTISTVADCNGIVTQENSLAWVESSLSLHDPPLMPGGIYIEAWDEAGNTVGGYTADQWYADLLEEPIPAGEVRYTSAYSSAVQAVGGATNLKKTVDLNTASQAAGHDNIAIDTFLAFNPVDSGGRATSTESLLVDGAGQQTTEAGSTLCPFINGGDSFVPAFCNIVDMGSTYDLMTGVMTTSADARFVSDTNTYPVTMDYRVSGTGTGTSPALGSIGATVAAHLQEGRMLNVTPTGPDIIDQPSMFVTMKTEDVVFSEASLATGAIDQFEKTMHYQSGLSLVA